MKNLFNKLFRYYWESKIFWTPRKLFYSLDEIEIKKPIFILGVQGGGLTLLSRMLLRNPSVVAVGANYKFWTGRDEIHNMPLLKFLSDNWTLRSPGYKNLIGNEVEHEIFGLERSWVYATDMLINNYRKKEKDWNPKIEEELKNIIKMSILAYAKNPFNARFLDKSQTFPLKIPLLKKIFPDAKFVVVVRNPYAMCWREVSKKPENKYRYWKKIPTLQESLIYAVQHWYNLYTTALTDLKNLKINYKIVKFEQLLKDPKNILNEVLSYIELDFIDEMIPSKNHKLPFASYDSFKWYPLKPNINEKYLKALPEKECKIIQQHLNKIASFFGYDAPCTN